MEHRRSDRRYDRRIAIEFVHEGHAYHAETINLSLGGVFIATDAMLPFGSRIQILFRVPTRAEAIELVGHVRWSQSGEETNGLGVRFERLSASEVWALNKFFRQPL